MCGSQINCWSRQGFGLGQARLEDNFECLELGLLECEHVKSPIPNMDYENNHVGNESESHKNRGKRGCKEQTIKIKPNWDAYFCLMIEYIVCVDLILLCYALYNRGLDTCRSFLVIKILWCNVHSILDECRALIQLFKKKKKKLFARWYIVDSTKIHHRTLQENRELVIVVYRELSK